MIYKLIILDLAIEDAQDAFDYYEKHQVNLGFRFENELANLIEYIHENPLHFKTIKQNYRQAILDNFPYLIVYYISDNTIYIQRVFHAKRNPKKKFKQ